MLCQPRSASWRHRPWISRGWRTRTRTTSVSSDSAAECATVNLVRKQNSNAPVVATDATAFARQAGSRCATLPLPAHDSCGTRPHSRWRHHLCAVCGPRDAQLPPSRQAEAEATTWSVSEMAVTCWHRCRGVQREAWQRPTCSGCQQLDRARTILWTSIGNMTGERCAKIRRSLGCETCT